VLRPSYSVQIGSSSIDPDSSTDLISLRVDMTMNGPAGCAESVLRLGSGGLGVEKGDSVTVSIGYKDDLTDVFTGVVDVLNPGFHSARVFALNSVSKLMRSRGNNYYEGQTCGAIVSDLVSTAEVTAGDVEDGLTLPYYAVDHTKTSHEHVMDLAKRCGFDVFADSDDQLCFKKYKSSPATTFEYGKDILHARRLDQEPVYKTVKVFGESPSSSQGDETVHWLTKEAIKGESGSGNELIVQDAALRDTDGTGSVADSIQGRYASSVVVVLETVGNAAVKLDDTVAIAGMPESSIDGEYQVTRVEHLLSKSGGYTTSFRLLGTSE
jgi:phage protein D